MSKYAKGGYTQSVYIEGQTDERERIIKLLEANLSEWIDLTLDCWDVADLIALIEGENK